MKANARHSAVILLVILSALAILLRLFPDIQSSSLIVAVGLVSGVIEIIGFLRDRSSREAGPQTNIAGDVQGSVYSGQFSGPVAQGGDANDFRGATGTIYKPGIIQREKLPVPRAPPPPQDFTGRGKELEEILKSFDLGATITGLRGTGGIGKTALALVMADRLKSRFPDGQIFLKLEGTSPNPLKPAEAMAQVIRAFRGSEERLPEDQNELQGLYNSVLEGKRILLILDNAADDKQVIPLLPPKGCAALVTSRQNFTLPGMLQPFSLDTMKPEEAKDLLLRISPRIGDGAGELARLCGHLPLALRAAASFLAVKIDLKPSAYLEALRTERTRLKKIGREGVDLDLEACFDLSYSRLSAETARVFRMLSVFPSDFDAAAEEVICQDEGHQHLSELLRWSLVEFPRPEGDGRYHLHDLVRLFAVGLLEKEEDSASEYEAWQRYSEHYRNVLSNATEFYKNGDPLSALKIFDLERANIESSWQWAKKNLAGNNKAASICSSSLNWPYILSLRLHTRELISRLETALVAAKKLNDRGMESFHLGNLGVAYRNLGKPRKAIEFFEQILKLHREIGDLMSEGSDLGNLGNAYFDLGEPLKAVEYYEQSLAIFRESGDRMGEGNALGNMGLAYAALGERRKAIEFFEQSLNISREIGNRRGEGADLGNLGIFYAALGEAGKAIEYFEQQLDITREIGDRRGEGNALWDMSLTLDSLNERSKAIKKAKDALEIYEQIESPYTQIVRQKLADWGTSQEN